MVESLKVVNRRPLPLPKGSVGLTCSGTFSRITNKKNIATRDIGLSRKDKKMLTRARVVELSNIGVELPQLGVKETKIITVATTQLGCRNRRTLEN